MQPGDLLFYPSSGRWYERVIEKATAGPFPHVAVVVDPFHIIAAETWGIKYEAAPVPGHPPLVTPLTLAPASKDASVEAFRWLNQQVGKLYGWVDIFDQGLRLLHSPYYLGRANSLDCSDLAACFAAIYTGDEKLMARVLDQRQLISPNDLARYYGLIK